MPKRGSAKHTPKIRAVQITVPRGVVQNTTPEGQWRAQGHGSAVQKQNSLDGQCRAVPHRASAEHSAPKWLGRSTVPMMGSAKHTAPEGQFRV